MIEVDERAMEERPLNMKSIESIVEALVTSANFKRGKVAKSVFETLEAGGEKITGQVKQAVYDSIDKRIKSLMPIGKYHMVLSCSQGGAINSDGDVVSRGVIRTEDTRELSLVDQIKLANGLYTDTLKKLTASKREDNSGLLRKLRKIRNTMRSICFLLELSVNPEDKTLAVNYRKYLAVETDKSVPVDKSPEVSSIVNEPAKQD